MAHFHARAIQQVRGLDISGVTSRTRESATAFAKMAQDNGLGDCLVYDSVGEMARHVDAIAIYSPNFTRVGIMEEIAAAVQAGVALKGVICEKPRRRFRHGHGHLPQPGNRTVGQSPIHRLLDV